MIHKWKGFHEYYNFETQKYDFIKKKYAQSNVSAVMFANNFLRILCTLIGAIMLSIKIQVGLHLYLC